MTGARLRIETAEQMRALAGELASSLAAGDLVILDGGLGAGKTTFTQGLGEALRVSGQVASPTFIIARTHKAAEGGLPLVHVDAYRLNSLEELDDLDLDASVDEAVTVVEWGSGTAEQLAESYLKVSIDRERGGEVDLEQPDAGTRIVTIEEVGPRWLGVELGLGWDA